MNVTYILELSISGPHDHMHSLIQSMSPFKDDHVVSREDRDLEHALNMQGVIGSLTSESSGEHT